MTGKSSASRKRCSKWIVAVEKKSLDGCRMRRCDQVFARHEPSFGVSHDPHWQENHQGVARFQRFSKTRRFDHEKDLALPHTTGATTIIAGGVPCNFPPKKSSPLRTGSPYDV